MLIFIEVGYLPYRCWGKGGMGLVVSISRLQPGKKPLFPGGMIILIFSGGALCFAERLSSTEKVLIMQQPALEPQQRHHENCGNQ
jgi:hypothetical protein